MGAEEKFDVIVVGGGPAGLTAAYVMAKAGLQVVVLERGDYCGSKNMFGGIFFTNIMREIMPDFEKDAPLERVVTKRRWSLMTPDGEMGGGFKFGKFAQPPHNNSYTVLRAKFDKWFSEKVEEAGAMILTGTVVDDFLRDEKGKINGVRARMDDGDIYGDVVILADGVNSLLAKKLNLHKELKSDCTIVAVKEVIELPEERIRDRFQLTGNEGVAYEYFGYAAQGAIGSGFIYTNKNTISVGVGGTIKSFLEHKINPNDALEYFKNHSAIAPLVRDGEQKEYSAHLIPDGGYNAISKLYTDNVLVAGDAAGFVNASLFHEGTNLAMMSGKLAGETIIKAKEFNDYSAGILAVYEHKLKESFVMKDLKKFRKLAAMLEHNPKLFEKYPKIMEEFVRDMFTVDGETKNMKQLRLVTRLLMKESPLGFLITGLEGRKVIL
jgi:electron transfer flavoprotein-quinone oxidoreductase